MKDHTYIKVADDEPKAKFQIPVFSGEYQIGWTFRTYVDKVPTWMIPKHFFDEDKDAPKAGTKKYPKLSMRDGKNVYQIVESQVTMSEHYDYAWFSDPKTNSIGKIAPVSKDVSFQGNLALIVVRGNVWQWSTTDTAKEPNDDSGEVCYKAPTDLGDCGAPVYQNNLVCGMHVGTDGANKWNKFIPMALILAEIRRRQSA
jgi:hypothetical protein